MISRMSPRVKRESRRRRFRVKISSRGDAAVAGNMTLPAEEVTLRVTILAGRVDTARRTTGAAVVWGEPVCGRGLGLDGARARVERVSVSVSVIQLGSAHRVWARARR